MNELKTEGWRRHGAIVAASCCLVLGLAGCAAGPDPGTAASAAESADVEPGATGGPELIECRLPHRVDRLGRQLTKLAARQQVQTSRDACLARKGEVVAAAERRRPIAPGAGEPGR